MKIEIEGVEGVIRALRRDAAKRLERPNANKGRSVIVGYTANYALMVHENLEAAHGQMYNAKYADEIAMSGAMKKAGIPSADFTATSNRGGGQQARYLAQPARELRNNGTLDRIKRKAMQAGAKMQHVLYLMGMRIQRESQKIVPVDTGNLKGSAFTKKE